MTTSGRGIAEQVRAQGQYTITDAARRLGWSPDRLKRYADRGLFVPRRQMFQSLPVRLYSEDDLAQLRARFEPDQPALEPVVLPKRRRVPGTPEQQAAKRRKALARVKQRALARNRAEKPDEFHAFLASRYQQA